MNKFKKSQVLMLFLLAITPLISSSLRSTYLYFISNIIIITLCAEAGLFSVLLKPLEDKIQFPSVFQKPLLPLEASSEKREAPIIERLSTVSEHVEEKVKLDENLESEEVVSVTNVDKVQKGPSRSSLFFIGNEEDDAEVIEEDIIEAEEEVEGVNGKELFEKAEAFISLFYNQLKKQREESRTYDDKAF